MSLDLNPFVIGDGDPLAGTCDVCHTPHHYGRIHFVIRENGYLAETSDRSAPRACPMCVKLSRDVAGRVPDPADKNPYDLIRYSTPSGGHICQYPGDVPGAEDVQSRDLAQVYTAQNDG